MAAPAKLIDAKRLLAAVADVGLSENDPRLTTRINEAQRRLVGHYNLLVRQMEYDRVPLDWEPLSGNNDHLILDDLDATKLMALALWREENNRLDLSEPLIKKAEDTVQTNLIAEIEAANKNHWKVLLMQPRGSFGWTKARFALDCADKALRYTDSRIARLICDAEEQLLMFSRPVGSIKERAFEIDGAGEFYLPEDVESILFASVGDIPVSVFSQAYDYAPAGPGRQTELSRGYADVLVDRGEDGTRRKYFVRQSCPTGCVRLLCKMRSRKYQANADMMVVRNFAAIKEMALASLASDKGDEKGIAIHRTQALAYVEAELKEHRGGAKAVLRTPRGGFLGAPNRKRRMF